MRRVLPDLAQSVCSFRNRTTSAGGRGGVFAPADQGPPSLAPSLAASLAANPAAAAASGAALRLAPRAQPLCFIGDLHGRADLLALLFAEIGNRDPDGAAQVIFLGDLIDRGPESAAVLAAVRGFCAADPALRHCLMGNHERMLLDFLEDPARHGPRWLRVGGEATLASYGLLFRHGRDAAAEHQRLAAALAAALPEGMRDWLAALPLFWRGEALQAAHAGSDPARPIEAQGAAELLWGRRRNVSAGPEDRIEIQGHLIVETAHLAQNRVWLDTGAWRSGRLSALWLGAEAEWLSLRLPGPVADDGRDAPPR